MFSTVFRAGEDGYHTFRIPAIVESVDGTLLAFSEGRRTGPQDWGDIDLVLRRSTDGGTTWGPLQVLVDDGPDRAGNPAPVVDRHSGRVLVLFNRSLGTDVEWLIRMGMGLGEMTAWVLHSDNSGATWSVPREITGDVKPSGWRWYAMGPVHGIQLTRGEHAGRLVIPANHSTEGGPGDEFLGAHAIYSDDGGDTWSLGAVDSAGEGTMNPSESTVVERVDGSLYFNTRNQTGDGAHRAVTTSLDGGMTFTGPYVGDPQIEAPVVQASVIRYGAVDRGQQQNHLLFSSPGHPEKRRDLTVLSSHDEGATWGKGRVLHGGPSAYSDLVVTHDRLVGVLFEAGLEGPYERIDYAVFGVGWLAEEDTIVDGEDATVDVPGKETDAVEAFPDLKAEACNPVAPVDFQGIDPGYSAKASGNWVQDKNWYLLTLLQVAPDLRAALASDGILKTISEDREDAFRQAVTACGDDAECLGGAIRWSDAQRDAVAEELVRVLLLEYNGNDVVNGHLRPSGRFHLQHELKDDGLLRAAWIGTIDALNRVIDTYALSVTDPSGFLGKVADDHPDALLFFEPALLVALAGLVRHGRDEAGRYEPLELGENQAALQRIPGIAWGAWRFPLILVPGWGPPNLTEPLASLGRDHCDLAAARWKAGLAPFLVLSGGHVSPDKTPYAEALEMKKYLMESHGVPEDAILVDPHARHTTTNLRNAARLWIRYGIPLEKPGLITTDFIQAGYIAELDPRCMNELGYLPYRVMEVLSINDDCFLPAPTSLHVDADDPLDP